MSDEAHPGKMHIYNARGYCWCGAHRDDWLRNEDMLERIGKAFKKLADEAKPPADAPKQSP